MRKKTLKNSPLPSSAAPASWLQRMSAFFKIHTSPRSQPAPASIEKPQSSIDEYRRAAAQHIYAHIPTRIYQGQLPPMLHAVVVLQIQLTTQGEIANLHWMRAPSHAPKVVTEIEHIVRSAAPFPPTQHPALLSYVETWLWDESGKFQLRTLTEGQRLSE